MFLWVPVRIGGMELTEQQRADLARRIKRQREWDFDTKKAAYVAAGVNSATWDKAEDPEGSLAPASLKKIVKLLWPDTGGILELMDPPLGANETDDDVIARIKAEGFDPQHERQIIDAILEARQGRLDPPQERKRGVS